MSLRVGDEPDPWESAADLAVALVPLLAMAPPRTVLNLNVPHLPLSEIRGVRWARVSGAGLIESAHGAGAWEEPNEEEIEGPAAAEAARAVMEGEPEEKGQIVLSVGSPFPHSGDLGLADAGAEDATLVAQGFAALTAFAAREPRRIRSCSTSSTGGSAARSRGWASPPDPPALLSPGGLRPARLTASEVRRHNSHMNLANAGAVHRSASGPTRRVARFGRAALVAAVVVTAAGLLTACGSSGPSSSTTSTSTSTSTSASAPTSTSTSTSAPTSTAQSSPGRGERRLCSPSATSGARGS